MDDAERQLWDTLKRGGEGANAARNTLAVMHQGFVSKMAHKRGRSVPSSIDVDELISAGNIGLLLAIERFDPNCGVKFMSYAAHRVQGEMADYLRSVDHLSRTMRKQVGQDGLRNLSLTHAYVDGEGGRDILLTDRLVVKTEPSIVDSDSWDMVEKWIAVLKPETARMFRMYWQEGLTMREIGEKVGVSESRVSQLLGDCLYKMRIKAKRLMGSKEDSVMEDEKTSDIPFNAEPESTMSALLHTPPSPSPSYKLVHRGRAVRGVIVDGDRSFSSVREAATAIGCSTALMYVALSKGHLCKEHTVAYTDGEPRRPVVALSEIKTAPAPLHKEPVRVDSLIARIDAKIEKLQRAREALILSEKLIREVDDERLSA